MPFWLSILLSILGVALVLSTLLLLWQWRRVAAQLQTLSTQAGTTDEQARAALANAESMLLTVEILNPLELARAHSRIGSSLAGVAPGLVRKRVYQTVAGELREELAERGVEANIELHRGNTR